MKLPHGVSANPLIRALWRVGYAVLRQKGSHMRLRHGGPPANLITIPHHNPFKTRTLHGILAEVARIRSISVESFAESLWLVGR